jgi:hypothetical protein
LAVLCCSISFSYAQDLSVEIKKNYDGIPFQEFVEDVERESPVRFFWNTGEGKRSNTVEVGSSIQ